MTLISTDDKVNHVTIILFFVSFNIFLHASLSIWYEANKARELRSSLT